ncbi:MAG: AraC family transcriptional regulator [Spirochaetales bacterium]|nr:AraC family transcriptional regulator [Spirochaetales bacterium]
MAHTLGFEDQYYFSRFFKKKTGAAPSAWRKLI